MITVDGKTYRNLVEQVAKNQSDIEDLNTLNILGIRVVGEGDTEDDLPEEYEGQYGDAYLIGVDPPYEMWVFTRPNDTMLEDHWFDLGVFPRPGNTPSISSDGTYIISTDPTTGATKNIVALADLKGEKGDTGAASTVPGPTGAQGPSGPCPEITSNGSYIIATNPVTGHETEIVALSALIGPAGPKGDSSGFITIHGYLTSADQLPTPASLGNLTYAYLVGTGDDPYNLYVQVGEDSTTAVWKDCGAFTGATYIESGGEWLNTWDADTKLDKDTGTGSFRRAYVINTDGSQTTMNMTNVNSANTIAIRDSNGRMRTAAPSADYDCATKYYADTKVSKLNSSNKVYVTVANAQQSGITYSTDATASTIVERDSVGRIKAQDPSDDLDVVTKSWMDADYGVALGNAEYQKNLNLWTPRSRSVTKNGMTCTMTGNKIVLNGTSTASCNFYLYTEFMGFKWFEPGTYALKMFASDYTNKGIWIRCKDVNSGIPAYCSVTDNYFVTFYSGSNFYWEILYVPANVTCDNLTFYVNFLTGDTEPDTDLGCNGVITHNYELDADLLWENSNPYTSFTEDYVTCNTTTTYPFYIIEYTHYASSENAHQFVKASFKNHQSGSYTGNDTFIVTSQSSGLAVRRGIAMANSSYSQNTIFHFGDAQTNNTTANDWLIPIRIYGTYKL